MADLDATIAALRDELEQQPEAVQRRVLGAAVLELRLAKAEGQLTIRVVPHSIVETDEENESDHAAPDGRGGWRRKHGIRKEIRRTNRRDDCPDCHRPLIAARDGLTPVPALICARLEGLRLAPKKLTPNDIIACGVTGA